MVIALRQARGAIRKAYAMSEEKKNYGQILKSSSIMGGSQVVSILIGMVRVKLVAVLLGPVGIGLLGIYRSIMELATNLAGLGINTSGVRDVAEAVGSSDDDRIARATLTLRRVCWLSGIVGAVLLASLSRPLSRLTFGSPDYSNQIAALSACVLMTCVAGGQMALIHGMRRIGDLARINIIGAVSGTIAAAGFYFWLGLEGIVPALVTLSAFGLGISFWYSRKIKVMKVQMTWVETFLSAKAMLVLGLVLVSTGSLHFVCGYVTRILIVHEIDLAAVGIFYAAYNLSLMFVDMITRAMGADFYPKLTSIAHDHGKMRNLVNQQSEMGLTLALPGLCGLIVLAPWVIEIFYSDAFMDAVELMRWCLVGCVCRVISWPLSFVVTAKNRPKIIAWVECSHQVFRMLLIVIGLKFFGLKGIAFAELTNSLVHVLTTYICAKRLIGFNWSHGLKVMMVKCFILIVLLLLSCMQLPLVWGAVLGLSITVFTTLWCLRGLCLRLDNSHIIVKWTQKIPLSRHLLCGIDTLEAS